MFSEDVGGLICRTLNQVDPRLVDHGERVARTVSRMLTVQGRYGKKERQEICLLALLHDIGAYKTEEIDQMVRFESQDVWEHSIYGCLFLEQLSPLKRWAKAVLFHHANVRLLGGLEPECREIAQMLNIADRADIFMVDEGAGRASVRALLEGPYAQRFDPSVVSLFLRALEAEDLPEETAFALDLSDAQREAYLRMIIYAIDFRSPHTVTHTITTTRISVEIARYLGLADEWLHRIWYGALLHDLGKVGIPVEILEFPGKLSAQAMSIMRTHVDITEQILGGVLDPVTANIALRHHEKLDGTGYPRGLHGDALNTAERIVAVADMASALLGTRSYKEAFSRERTLGILREEAEAGRIDALCVRVFTEHFDQIYQEVQAHCNPVIEIYHGIHREYDVLVARKNQSLRTT